MAGLGPRPPEAMPAARPKPRGPEFPPAAQPGPQAASPAPAAPMGLEKATPEEQAQLEEFVSYAMTMLYDENTMPGLIKAVSSGEPDQAAGAAAATVAARLVAMAEDEGTDIDGAILLHGIHEIVEMVIEIVEEGGGPTFTPQMGEAAFYAAMQDFIDAARQMGVYTDEDAMRDFEMLNQMKQSGQLDAILQQMMAAPEEAPAAPAGGPETAAGGPMARAQPPAAPGPQGGV